ncbi:MAG: 30S ribosomal protein S24e [Candidatus Thermoplasmatota archaeon]
MEINIQDQKYNTFLNRTEIKFLINHPNEVTPRRETVREELAGRFNTKKEQVIIDHMRSVYGMQRTVGYAKIYETLEKASSTERKCVLKRNGFQVKEKKKKEETKTEKPAGKAKGEQPVKEEKKNTA